MLKGQFLVLLSINKMNLKCSYRKTLKLCMFLCHVCARTAGHQFLGAKTFREAKHAENKQNLFACHSFLSQTSF